MSDSTHLGLPFILPAQAQKHVTHNEALRVLDVVVQLSVLDRNAASPPAEPDEGERYIVAAAASGAWTGKETQIAAWQDGAWVFLAPQEGWLCWVADEDALLVWRGAAWFAVATGGGGGGTFDTLGVNATADATNRLAVASAAILLNHAGAGHQVKINKAAAADTASLLFQTAFSGRAEMGTAGGDDFRFKVSADGAAWHDAIVIDRTTGAVSMPNTISSGGGGGIAVIPSHIAGLKLGNNATDPNNDIDIAAGAAADATDSAMIFLAAMTKRLDAEWAAGTGQGGLFTGAKAANAWYHVFALRDPIGDVNDAGFDTSIVAANRPPACTLYRRLGSVRTDASGNMIAFVQYGNEFHWRTTARLDVDVANLGTSRAIYALGSVPPGVAVRAQTMAMASNTGSAFTRIDPLYVPDTAPNLLNGFTLLNPANVTIALGSLTVWTNTSQQIAARASTANTTLKLFVTGWKDYL